jgi:hypothetical protein
LASHGARSSTLDAPQARTSTKAKIRSPPIYVSLVNQQTCGLLGGRISSSSVSKPYLNHSAATRIRPALLCPSYRLLSDPSHRHHRSGKRRDRWRLHRTTRLPWNRSSSQAARESRIPSPRQENPKTPLAGGTGRDEVLTQSPVQRCPGLEQPLHWLQQSQEAVSSRRKSDVKATRDNLAHRG